MFTWEGCPEHWSLRRTGENDLAFPPAKKKDQELYTHTETLPVYNTAYSKIPVAT